MKTQRKLILNEIPTSGQFELHVAQWSNRLMAKKVKKAGFDIDVIPDKISYYKLTILDKAIEVILIVNGFVFTVRILEDFWDEEDIPRLEIRSVDLRGTNSFENIAIPTFRTFLNMESAKKWQRHPDSIQKVRRVLTAQMLNKL